MAGQLDSVATLSQPDSMPELSRSPVAHRRYLVFTSAGDRNAVASWLGPSREFDLMVVWYGQGEGAVEDLADYYLRRPGSKFQNLHYCFRRWPELLERYEAVMLMDDDVLIPTRKINSVFSIRKQYDFWALQPAFSPMGKLSHRITRVRRECELRCVDFIEMTCPLFRTDKLCDFLRVYDPQLVGWGCDWWYMFTMGPDLRGRVAIIDSVVCINPHDSWKPGGGREIDRLQSMERRKATWERIRDERGIHVDPAGSHEFFVVLRPIWLRWFLRWFGVGELFAVRLAKSLRRAFRSQCSRARRTTVVVPAAPGDQDSGL